MKNLILVLAVATIVSAFAAACGDDNGQLTPGPISSGVGPGLSIDEALTSNLAGPLLINGHLHAQDGQVRLCELLAESFPPQCGGTVLVVQGLDLTTMNGLTSDGSVTWSDQLVQVLGTVESEVLTVAGTASGGSPQPSLKFDGVDYVHGGSAELPPGEGADFVINGTEISVDDLERVGTTNEGNTPGIQEGLVVYRLKDDGTNDVYTFTPGEDHLNPEDGQIFKGQDVWTRWTLR